MLFNFYMQHVIIIIGNTLAWSAWIWFWYSPSRGRITEWKLLDSRLSENSVNDINRIIYLVLNLSQPAELSMQYFCFTWVQFHKVQVSGYDTNSWKIWPVECQIRFDTTPIWHPIGGTFQDLHHITESEFDLLKLESVHWSAWMKGAQDKNRYILGKGERKYFRLSCSALGFRPLVSSHIKNN